MDKVETIEPRARTESEKLADQLTMLYSRIIPAELQQSPAPVNVISVASGHFVQEVPAVYKVIANPQLRAIDNSLTPGIIRMMSKEYERYPGFDMVQADASDPENIGVANWDLAIIRNPQVGSGGSADKINPMWRKIIVNTMAGVKPGGHLLLSSLLQPEFHGVLDLIAGTNQFDIIKKEDPISPPLQTRFPMTETTIALLKKK